MKARALLTAAVLCLAGPPCSWARSSPAKEKDQDAIVGIVARDDLKGQNGRSLGEVRLTETSVGMLVQGTLSNLPAGEHAIHIHESGKCEAPFATAGGHLNPPKKKQGILMADGKHEGDLPKLHVDAGCKVRFDFFAHDLNMSDIEDQDGAAVIVHAGRTTTRAIPPATPATE